MTQLGNSTSIRPNEHRPTVIADREGTQEPVCQNSITRNRLCISTNLEPAVLQNMHESCHNVSHRHLSAGGQNMLQHLSDEPE